MSGGAGPRLCPEMFPEASLELHIPDSNTQAAVSLGKIKSNTENQRPGATRSRSHSKAEPEHDSSHIQRSPSRPTTHHGCLKLDIAPEPGCTMFFPICK